MGQKQSGSGSDVASDSAAPDSLLAETVIALGHEIRKQANMFKDINTLEYDDFLTSLAALNRLSAGCTDSRGMRMVFVVHRGTDQTPLWRVTTRIACVRVNPATRQIDRHQVMSLRQFNNVFKTIQGHVSVRSEAQLDRVMSMSSSSDDLSDESGSDDLECIICMDRKADVSFPCTHYYCYPCIQQWKESHNTCPLCQQVMADDDESWVLTEHPDVNEVNEKIRSELMGLADSDDTD